jgi:hypothetical protein
MSNEYSLMRLMNDDNDFIKRMEQKKIAVHTDKVNLSKAADEYSKKYAHEIEEGTKKKQLLIEDGRRRGLTEEESCKALATFIPSKNTPILNMLYFLLYEYEGASDKVQFLREQKNIGVDINVLQEQMEKDFGHLEEKIEEKELPDLGTFIYDNVTLDTFNVIKKLKALSKSPNEHEAFRAYTKCLELCRRYNLEFDKIPCNIK